MAWLVTVHDRIKAWRKHQYPCVTSARASSPDNPCGDALSRRNTCAPGLACGSASSGFMVLVLLLCLFDVIGFASRLIGTLVTVQPGRYKEVKLVRAAEIDTNFESETNSARVRSGEYIQHLGGTPPLRAQPEIKRTHEYHEGKAIRGHRPVLRLVGLDSLRLKPIACSISRELETQKRATSIQRKLHRLTRQLS